MKHPNAPPDTPKTAGSAEVGIYLHWPFCQSKCPYCDFNSHVAGTIDIDRWGDALVAEVRRHHALLPDVAVASVFFGGGTPSLMPAALVGRLLQEVDRLWGLSADTEVSLEANPTSAERARFVGFRAAGVNRVSVGVQSLDDRALRRLGRMHSAQDARKAVELAQETFPRVSADLIYARQDQTTAEWESELQAALRLGTTHLSLYQLTIEDGTVFAARQAQGKLPGLPDEDLAVEQYEVTQQICEAAGRPGYEISNHAQPGEECRHNLIYWRCGTFLGIGPGAHGRLSLPHGRVATIAHRAPDLWLQAVEAGRSGDAERTTLSAAEVADEFILMGLRLADGLPISAYETLAGRAVDRAVLCELLTEGHVTLDKGRLRLTLSGRLLANSVIARLAVPMQDP